MEYEGRDKILQLRILYSEGCANTPRTVELVKNVAQQLNVPIRMEMVPVGTREEAQALRFIGSPTVQIDGVDIDPSALDSLTFGLT